MCSCEDADGPAFFSQSIVTARKWHRCVECLAIIEVGDVYESSSGKWDGEVETLSTCARCVRLRSAYGAIETECLPPFGQLRGCAKELLRYGRGGGENFASVLRATLKKTPKLAKPERRAA